MRGKFDKNIICKHCGRKFNKRFFVDLGRNFKWKVFWQAMAVALILEFIANLMVYFLFR